MNWSFWSDEDRWFVPRKLGLGYSLNLKHLVRRLGWVKSSVISADTPEATDSPMMKSEETREERLRRQIESSKYEGHE